MYKSVGRGGSESNVVSHPLFIKEYVKEGIQTYSHRSGGAFL